VTREEEEHVMTHTIPTGNGPATTDQAKEKVQGAASQVKDKAGAQLRSQVDERSTDAGHRLGGVASDVRGIGETLREQGKDEPAKLADRAADHAERLGGYLRDNDADRILGDVEDFGRRQPWVVIAGGVALGLVASRFLKASSSRRYEQQRESQARLPAPANGVSPAASPGHRSPTYVSGEVG
jgi:hypothetical protein